MKWRMDRFAAMRAFVTVAKLRGFAPAARQLGVSAPAVTRLVAGLEDQLSVRLLQRTTRSVALTDVGARYFERAQRVLAELDEAERNARAEHARPTGRFAISAPQTFGRLHVAPLVSRFLLAHPEVSVELVLVDRLVSLVDEGFDAAIRIGVLDDSSLRARVVGSTRRVVVGSPGYFAKHKRPRTPRDLHGHELIHLSGLSPTPEWRFARAGREQRIAIAPRLTTSSADAAVTHALRGGGIAMLLSYQVHEQLKSGALETVLARYEPEPVPIQLVHSSARLPSASLRAFIEMTAATRSWRL